MSDAQERTERATEKRMKEVRSKGKLSTSKDLTAWLGVGAAVVMLPATITAFTAAGADQVYSVRRLVANPDPALALQVLREGLGSMGAVLGPLFIVVVIAVLGGAAVQGGIHLKKFTGHYEQFNLVTGVKRVFGMQALWEGAKALMKFAVVGLALYVAVQGLIPVLTSTGGLSISTVLDAAKTGTLGLFEAAVAAGIALAAIDVFVVFRRNRKQSRMTKKEVTDEHKNTEGDPLIRSQRRARQLAMSRNRMIAAISTSDVVVVNPIHFAIALSYTPGSSAPKVVAKGAGHIALRIREQAEADRVPVVRDVPLARALHASCKLGDEIPAEFYTPVARVLAFVLALKARGGATGTHTMSQSAQRMAA